MINYLVAYRGKRKTVAAAHPLSACRKAFTARGRHWEYAARGPAIVYQDGIAVGRLRLQDNG